MSTEGFRPDQIATQAGVPQDFDVPNYGVTGSPDFDLDDNSQSSPDSTANESTTIKDAAPQFLEAVVMRKITECIDAADIVGAVEAYFGSVNELDHDFTRITILQIENGASAIAREILASDIDVVDIDVFERARIKAEASQRPTQIEKIGQAIDSVESEVIYRSTAPLHQKVLLASRIRDASKIKGLLVKIGEQYIIANDKDSYVQLLVLLGVENREARSAVFRDDTSRRSLLQESAQSYAHRKIQSFKDSND